MEAGLDRAGNLTGWVLAAQHRVLFSEFPFSNRTWEQAMLRTALQPFYPLLSPRPLVLPLVERQSAAWWTETLPLHLESQGVRSFAVVGFSACDSCLEATPPSFGTCPDLGPSDSLEAVYPGHTDTMTNRDFLRTRFFLDLRHTSRRATARDSGTRRAQVTRSLSQSWNALELRFKSRQSGSEDHTLLCA